MPPEHALPSLSVPNPIEMTTIPHITTPLDAVVDVIHKREGCVIAYMDLIQLEAGHPPPPSPTGRGSERIIPHI
jgi:hypothetical protein